MKNFEIFFLAIIFIFIAIINSNFLEYFGIGAVSGTYEFTKVISFNILFSIFIIFFTFKNFKENIYIPKIIFIFFVLFLFSIFTASYPLTNIFGNNLKAHGIIFLSNLVILYTILLNFEKNKLEKLVKYITFFSPIIFILGILEFASKGDFVNIGFLNYNNFFILFSLLLTPFITKKLYYLRRQNFRLKEKFINFGKLKIDENKIAKYFYIFVFILISINLFLLKSIFALAIFIGYIQYFLIKNIGEKIKKFAFFSGFGILFLTFFIFNYEIKEELEGVLSKIFIWKSTYNAISGNVSSAFFGVGNDSLIYNFEPYKEKFLYILENIGFTVDKPNNFLLEIFYGFGILGVVLCLNCLHNFFIGYKNSTFHLTILIFLIFTFFNFASVVNYFFITIIIALISVKHEEKKYFLKTKIFFIIFAVLSIFTSIIYYFEESKFFKDNNYKTKNHIYSKLLIEDREKEILDTNSDIFKICEKLLQVNKSAETFFYCGNFYWKIGYKGLAQVYYQKGLEKLPDVWKENSKSLKNIFVKYFYDERKFFDKKYSNLKEILERINEEKGKNI